MLTGYKKFLSFLAALAYYILAHLYLGKPAPELDKLVLALTAIYQAVEGGKDAVVGFAAWWKGTHPDASRAANDGLPSVV